MNELTGEEPYTYVPMIIGFGTCHYMYASYHEGIAPRAAFSPRRPEIEIYATGGMHQQRTEPMKSSASTRRPKAACTS